MRRVLGALVKNIHWSFYAVFLLVQAFAHRFIVLFGDDYYYANFFAQGWNYFIEETAFHYMKTNGRFFVHLIDEILLGTGIWLWKLFNLAVIAFIVLFVAKIAAKTYEKGYDTKEFKISLISCVFLFSAISTAVYINCIYWATGAVNYLFPIALVLAYFYYSKKDLVYNKGYKWLPILAFFASFTVEQSSAAALAVSVYVIVTCVYRYKRRPRITYFISFASSAIALVSVVFAPGNTVRMSYYPDFYELDFLGKIFNALHTFLYQIFGPYGLFLVLVLLSAFTVWLLCRAAKKCTGKKRAFFALLAAACALSLVFYALLSPVSNKTPWAILFAVIFVCLPLVIYFIYTVREYFVGEDDESVLFFLLAVVLQVVMLISPEFGYRTLLISLILLFVPTLKCVLLVSKTLAVRAKGILRAAAVLVVTASLLNPVVMGLGYMENYPVHEYNRNMMERLVSGEIESVKLAYPINDKYRYTMPYESWYHMMRYMQLWGLPKDMVIEYEKYPT